MLLCLSSAHPVVFEKIEVAPDSWTFRTAGTHVPFVPLGVNYTPGDWAQNFKWIPDTLEKNIWDENKVENDFAILESLGVNVVKIGISYARLLPDPQSPGSVRMDAGTLERFDKFLEIAARHNIRIAVAIESWWTRPPGWFYVDDYNREPFIDTGIQKILHEFWKQFAGMYAGDGRIFYYSLAVEMNETIPWKSNGMVTAWAGWLKEKYADTGKLNSAWGTGFKSFEDIKIPGCDGINARGWGKYPEGTDENENKTGDPVLYDYLLFREFLAFRYIYNMATGVKEGDPEALAGMGFVQWNPILRSMAVNEGPLVGLEFNAREMGRALDILTIHFYPVMPDANELMQLRYFQEWARYAYIGKPVIIEEFNSSGMNAWWCRALIEESRDFASGWLSWTYRNTPDSDAITVECGLVDTDYSETAWGMAFRKLSPKVKEWELTRKPADRVMEIDKKWFYTSGDYRKILDGIIGAKKFKPVDFKMDSNESIDRLIEGYKKGAVKF